jgi:farnesyl diphosphate synthase
VPAPPQPMPPFPLSANPQALPFDAAITQARDLVAGRITFALSGLSGPLPDAMRYAVSGGKGLRGFLVLESARLHGIAPDKAAPAAAAIESLHAYSLIHDDLPCMDDDDLRRGQPTVHRKWDEATAVLAGDALQSLAFELVVQTDCPAAARAELALGLAQAAGVRGMAGGQAADIAAETALAPLTLDQIIALQAGKTGALITWSAMAGARMAGADPAPLRIYGDCLGLAFQITDDILDVTGDPAKTGKRLHKDAQAGKATFVSLLGLDAARNRARALIAQAEAALSPYAGAGNLIDAAHFVLNRES